MTQNYADILQFCLAFGQGIFSGGRVSGGGIFYFYLFICLLIRGWWGYYYLYYYFIFYLFIFWGVGRMKALVLEPERYSTCNF